jgi:hypothetical protein
MIVRLESTGENVFRKRTLGMQIETSYDQMDTRNIVPLIVELRTSFIACGQLCRLRTGPIPVNFRGFIQ